MSNDIEDVNEPSAYALAILRGLQRKPVFEGLTDEQWVKVEKRRAKNKVARASRRRNRVS